MGFLLTRRHQRDHALRWYCQGILKRSMGMWKRQIEHIRLENGLRLANLQHLAEQRAPISTARHYFRRWQRFRQECHTERARMSQRNQMRQKVQGWLKQYRTDSRQNNSYLSSASNKTRPAFVLDPV